MICPLYQPTTGADKALDETESDNSVTDLYNSHNTPTTTYNDDLNQNSQTAAVPGRIALSKTSAEETIGQTYEDDLTSSVLELLSSTEQENIDLRSTSTTKAINSSEFEELDLRGISGQENNNIDRQDYAQSRSLKLGEGGNPEERKQEEEEEEVS